MVETPEKTGNGAPGAEILCLAAHILRTAGLDAGEVARVLRDLYGVEVDAVRVGLWLVTPPTWWFPIHLLDKSKLWALRYAVGAALGDGNEKGELEVADWEFARAYAEAVTTLTGREAGIGRSGGRYRVGCRTVGRIAKSPLWKTIAYLDRLDERKHFLSGLLDAEGSLIPLVDGRRRNLRVRIQFVNTSRELIEFIRDALKELGLEPRIWVQEPGDMHVKRGGGVVRRKRTVYKVYADLNLSKIELLTRVGFHCWRKKLLLEFFLEISGLPRRQAYEEFHRRFRKIRGKWWPIIRSQQLRSSLFTVECPKCGEAGTFELRRATGKVQALIRHGGGSCEIDVAEGEVKGGENRPLVNCPKCGRRGYVYCVAHYTGRAHLYIRVRVVHKLRRKEKSTACSLFSLRVLGVRTKQPPPARETKGEQNNTKRTKQTQTAEHTNKPAPLPHINAPKTNSTVNPPNGVEETGKE